MLISMSRGCFLIVLCISPHVAQGQPTVSGPGRIVLGREVRLGGKPDCSQWEPSAVVSRKDPKRLLVSCIVDPPSGAKQDKQTCTVFCSEDGGATWNSHEFAPQYLADPVVAFDPDGNAYLSCLYVDPGPASRVALHRSNDGGRTWGPRILLSNERVSADHPMIVTDHTAGKFAGRIYIGVYDVRQGISVDRSDDGGKTFQSTVAVPDWSNKDAYVHNLLVLSDGTLFVPLAEVNAKKDIKGHFIADSVAFSSIVSSDGGLTFSRPRKMSGRIKVVAHGPGPTGLGAPSNVVCAAGRHEGKDRIYALWCEPRETGGLMRLTHSDDCGVTWSLPRDVTANTPAGSGHGACNLAVSRDGVVGVSWLNHEPGGKYDVWFTASADGGIVFLPPVKISRQSSRRLPGQERSFPGADYMLMDGGPDGTFHVIWPDARTGNAYQLFTCKVKLSQSGE